MPDPIRVGILNDMSAGPPGPASVEPWLRLAVDELRAQGRLDAPVEYVHAWGLGLPSGSAAAVESAFAELADKGVVLVVGPAIGDNALVATPLAETCRLPTLNWAGAERARGEYMFQLQVGSHEDESIVLARHFAARGLRRIGVIHDSSPIGDRHLEFLALEASIAGLDIAASASLPPLAEDAGEEVARILGEGIDALVYLGLGVAAPAVSRALHQQGWQGPCAMNTAGIRGYDPAFARLIDGWIYVDLHADGNSTLQSLRRRLAIPQARSLQAAKGYDLGRLVAEALSRAPAITRDGIREGLERIKWLPAAQGHEGTLLGFGVYDRGALHGPYLVLRQWRRGESLEINPAG